jgi:hypothetical protein
MQRSVLYAALLIRGPWLQVWVPDLRRSVKNAAPRPGHEAASPSPASESGKHHTDAVVTPPSTTMVWPVMKLEASEPR